MAGRPVRISIVASGSQARGEFTKIGGAAGQMGEKVSLAGKVMKGVFAGMGGWFAATELTHGIKELVDETSKFQSSMTLLQTAGGETAKNMSTVSNGILDLAGKTGTAIDDLSEGMYTVEKAAYRGAAGLKVLKAAAEGARAENVDMATMTDAVTSVMTSYHDKAADATKVVNEMVAASGAAKTTMQKFAGSLSTVLPVASANKISFEEVGGALATLTQHGTSADEATLELANTIRNLSAPNQVAQKEMQQLGLNVTDVSTKLGKRGLTGTLDLLVSTITKQMGSAGTVLLDAFKKSQSASSDLQVMLGKMPKPLRDISQQFLDGSETAKDYKTDIKDMGAQGYAMGSQFMSLATTASGFNDLLKSGQPAAQTFTDALKKMLGGATGMNTALMLTGENMGGFKDRVKEIGDAGKQSGKDIATWAQTQATFAVQLDKVKYSLEALGVKAGMKFLPWATAGLEDLNDDLGKVEPKLETFAHVIGDVAGVIGDIPGPIKSMGVEALLLIPILGRAQTAVSGLTTRVATSAGGMKMWGSALMNAETRSTALGLAGLKLKENLGMVAGIGGMLALQNSTNQTNAALSSLERIAGSAAIGFSVGGPWGASIGGMVGILGGLKSALSGSADAAEKQQEAMARTAAMQKQKQAADDLRSSLDQLTGAYTTNTRETVYNQLASSGALKAAQGLGLSARTIVNSLLGQESAQKRVNAAITGATKAYRQAAAGNQSIQGQALALDSLNPRQKELLSNAIQLRGALGLTNKQLKEQVTNVRNEARATQSLPQLLKATQRQLGLTSKQFASWPKAVRTKLALDGIPQSKSQLEAFAHQVKVTKPVATALLKVTGLDTSKRNIDALVSAMRGAEGKATAAGSTTGSNFGTGLVAGIRAHISSAEAAAAEIVNRALKSAAAAQDSRSPAKKTIALGKYFGQGYSIGIQKQAKPAAKQAEKMVIKALAGAKVHTASGLHDITDKVIVKANKSLEKQVSAAQKQLEKVKAVYSQVNDAIVGSADITTMGANPVGVVSYPALLAGLQQQTTAAAKWAADIKKLTALHLNNTDLQQLIAAGPSSISTAEALLTGGKKGIAQVNTLTKQLQATSTSLAKSASKSMYGVGLDAAKGMLQGLNKEKRQFEKWAKDIASTLTKEVKKQLKIKSPSRVFQEIGAYTGQGLVIGLDSQQTYVKRSAANMAAATVKGFGTPALKAVAADPSLLARQAAAGGNTYQITVQTGVGDPVAIGKQVATVIDAYERAGGRRR